VVMGYAIALFITLFINNFAFSLMGNDVTFVYAGGYPFYIYLLVLLAVILSSLIYAMFTSILVFVVRRDLFQGVKKLEMVKHIIKSTTNLFILTLIVNIIYFIIYIIFVNTVVAFLIPILYFILAIFVFYCAQSIVIDEEGVGLSLEHNWKFMNGNKLTTFIIYLIFVVLIWVVSLIATWIGGTTGLIVGLILNTVFIVPLLEITKTIVYLTKFNIFNSYLKHK
jgi:hypothetical protein